MCACVEPFNFSAIFIVYVPLETCNNNNNNRFVLFCVFGKLVLEFLLMLLHWECFFYPKVSVDFLFMHGSVAFGKIIALSS